MTLVEVATSVVVVTVSLLGTAGAVTAGARISRTTAETRAAARATSALLERVRATPFDDVVATFDGNCFAVPAIDPNSGPGSATMEVLDEDAGSTTWLGYRVVVTVRWRGAAGVQERRIVTFVGDRRRGSAL